MNRRLLASVAFAAIAVLAIAAWFSRRESAPPAPAMVFTATPSPEPPPILAPASTTSSPEAAAPASKSSARTSGSPLAAELNAPGFDAQHDVATLHEILRQYLRNLRGRPGRPIGNDSDLARVLTGRNPMKLVVVPPNHPALSADGRLRDRWGTPYFIHPLGRLAFEIRSAGPDRKLFTADDLVESPSSRAGESTPAAIEEPPDE